MNIYTHKFIARCPANGKPINYTVTITKASSQKIYVEHIAICAAMCETGYHEEIADIFYKHFGGEQVMCAHHHGTDIETRRGFADDDSMRLPERIIMGKLVIEKGVELRAAFAGLRTRIAQGFE